MGETTFVTFCAGCHGLNGIAAYVDSPSFALGDRMEKPDAELIESVRNGKGVMPSWGDKLSDRQMRDVLGFVRSLEDQYEAGIVTGIRRAPGLYFLFGPMTRDPAAYQSDFQD